jgi:hypothetical protein
MGDSDGSSDDGHPHGSGSEGEDKDGIVSGEGVEPGQVYDLKECEDEEEEELLAQAARRPDYSFNSPELESLCEADKDDSGHTLHASTALQKVAAMAAAFVNDVETKPAEERDERAARALDRLIRLARRELRGAAEAVVDEAYRMRGRE